MKLSRFLLPVCVLLWHAGLLEGQKLLKALSGHDGMVRAVKFSPDGRFVVTGGSVDTEKNDWTAKIWAISAEDPNDWKLVKELLPKKGRHYDQVMAVAFRPDGKRIAVADEKASHIYDLSSSKPEEWAEIRELKAHKAWTRAIAWSQDGKRLFSCSDDATTVLWDLSSENPADWKKSRILKGHKGGTYSMALSADGKYIATGGSDFTVRIWDITSPDSTTWKEKEVKALKGHKRVIRSLAWAPNGKMLVSASDDATARVWDVSSATAAEWKEAKSLAHKSTIPSVSFSADSNYIVTGSSDFDSLCKIWSPAIASDLTSWRELAEVKGHTAAIRGVNFWGGVDGKRWLLGTAGDDEETRIWELDKETLGLKKSDEL